MSHYYIMSDPSNRKAVVTGGGSGIGRSIVQKFSESGIQTVAGDVVMTEDLSAHQLRVDLAQTSEVQKFCTDVKRLMGTPDILVCNAGRGIHEKLTEGDPERWEEIFRLNVFSNFHLIRNFVPGMLERKAGDVVFISSISSRKAYEYGGVYSASKAAVDMLAETLRLEVQPSVRVTVIRPGVVASGFFKSMIGSTHTPEDIGWGALQPGQVADSVLYAVSQPREVMLNDMVIRPAAQPL